MFKSVLMRFLKGAIAGAVASMSVISYQTPVVWSDFHLILNNLAIACVAGAMGGLMLALQKWASWKE